MYNTETMKLKGTCTIMACIHALFIIWDIASSRHYTSSLRIVDPCYAGLSVFYTVLSVRKCPVSSWYGLCILWKVRLRKIGATGRLEYMRGTYMEPIPPLLCYVCHDLMPCSRYMKGG